MNTLTIKVYVSRLVANLAAALLKSLVKFMKMEGEHGRLIKPIIYAFENISAKRSAAFAGPKIPEMTRQVGRDGVYGPRHVHRFRCVTIKAVGGSRDQINNVINPIKYHHECQQCGRIPRGIGSEARV